MDWWERVEEKSGYGWGRGLVWFKRGVTQAWPQDSPYKILVDKSSPKRKDTEIDLISALENSAPMLFAVTIE
jgi:hypothetical protein